MRLSDLLPLFGVVAVSYGSGILESYYHAMSGGVVEFDFQYRGEFLVGLGIVLILSGLFSRTTRNWERHLKLRVALLILATALFALSLIDVIAAWTIGQGPTQGFFGNSFAIIEGVDFRLMVTELSTAASLTVASLFVEVHERSKSGGY